MWIRKLKNFLEREDIPLSVFADKLHVPYTTVQRWLDNEALPPYPKRKKIQWFTKGEVSWDDVRMRQPKKRR